MIDLHCHTKVSDNSLTIGQVIDLAQLHGVTHLAITDHDTTLGLDEATCLGQRAGIEIIPGIEISAYDYKRKVRAHILGYYIEPGHGALETICRPMVERRNEVAKVMVERIKKHGYDINWGQVEDYAKGSTSVFKQHIMHALMDKGYCKEIYGTLYTTLFSRDEKNGKQGIAHVSVDYVDVVEAIQAVRAAGGVPVLAHPGQFNNYAAIPEWVEIGLEGVEIYNPSHQTKDEWRSQLLADQYDLIMTGGSDFHGLYGDLKAYPGCRNPGLRSVVELIERAHTIQRVTE